MKKLILAAICLIFTTTYSQEQVENTPQFEKYYDSTNVYIFTKYVKDIKTKNHKNSGWFSAKNSNERIDETDENIKLLTIVPGIADLDLVKIGEADVSTFVGRQFGILYSKHETPLYNEVLKENVGKNKTTYIIQFIDNEKYYVVSEITLFGHNNWDYYNGYNNNLSTVFSHVYYEPKKPVSKALKLNYQTLIKSAMVNARAMRAIQEKSVTIFGYFNANGLNKQQKTSYNANFKSLKTKYLQLKNIVESSEWDDNASTAAEAFQYSGISDLVSNQNYL
jgi:hypothetical protein